MSSKNNNYVTTVTGGTDQSPVYCVNNTDKEKKIILLEVGLKSTAEKGASFLSWKLETIQNALDGALDNTVKVIVTGSIDFDGNKVTVLNDK